MACSQCSQREVFNFIWKHHLGQMAYGKTFPFVSSVLLRCFCLSKSSDWALAKSLNWWLVQSLSLYHRIDLLSCLSRASELQSSTISSVNSAGFSQADSIIPSSPLPLCARGTIACLQCCEYLFAYIFPEFLVFRLFLSFVFVAALTYCRYLKHDFWMNESLMLYKFNNTLPPLI